MKPVRGTLIEVEVDHSKLSYADFVRVVNELGGRVLVKDGYWPLARYKIAIPKRNAGELLKLLEQTRTEAGSATSGP